ncbi:MAG: hypothetical protein ACJ72L_18595 [Marmoricola sp.]
MTVSVPAPRLPKWVPWTAGALWLVLLAGAAALRTLGTEPGFWRIFFADVFATGASLGFALAGAATVLTRWELRQQQVEVAKTTILELDLAASAVHQVIDDLLHTLESVVSLVRLAGPGNLAWLLRPPVDTNARELVQNARVSSGFPEPPDTEFEAGFLDSFGNRPARPKVADDPGGWQEACWFDAKQAARVFAKIDDDDAAQIRFITDGGPHLLNAERLVGKLSSLTEDLQIPSLDSSRHLRRDARHLVTNFEYLSSPGGDLAPLVGAGATYQGKTGFGLGVKAVWQFLDDSVLPVCDDLVAVRQELAALLADDVEDNPFGLLAEMKRDEGLVSLSRQGPAISIAGTLAFEWDKHWQQIRAAQAHASSDPQRPGQPGPTKPSPM